MLERLAVVIMCVVGAARPVHAQPEPYDVKAVSLDVTAASDAPAGNWSVGLTWDAGRWFSLSGGAGRNVTGGKELRAVIAPRVRLIRIGAVAADLALGFSYAGRDHRSTVMHDGSVVSSLESEWYEQHRLNPELGLTYRLAPRIAVRAFAGVGFPVSRRSCTYNSTSDAHASSCDDPVIPEALRDVPQRFPYAGVTVSLAAFPLGQTSLHDLSLRRPDRWYGWQLMAVDAAVVTFGLAALRDPSDAYVADLTAAAAVHVLHEHPWRGVSSAALRVALGLLGAAVGIIVTPSPPGDGSEWLAGAAPGFVAGTAVAMALDYAALSWD